MVVNHTEKEEKFCWDLHLLELVSKANFSACSITASPCICGRMAFGHALGRTGRLLYEDVVEINELMFEMFSDSLL